MHRPMMSSASKGAKWQKQITFEQVDFRRLFPLWRYGVWMAMFFMISALWAQNRIVVNDLRDDLGRTMNDLRDAEHRHEQLQLEHDKLQSIKNLYAEAAQRQFLPAASHQVVAVNRP